MKITIFLVDSFGALLSAVLLLIIPEFFPATGISKELTSNLVAIPFLFFIYSLIAYKYGYNYWRLLLKIIALANILYCCLTVFIIFIYFKSIGKLGVTYFILEIIVIMILVFFEMKIANKNNK